MKQQTVLLAESKGLLLGVERQLEIGEGVGPGRVRAKSRQHHSSNVDAQPISGFSHRSGVSHVTSHSLALKLPDCVVVLAGRVTRATRLASCTGVIPVNSDTSSPLF